MIAYTWAADWCYCPPGEGPYQWAGKSQRGIPLFCNLCGRRHVSLDGRLPSVGFRRDPSVLCAWWTAVAPWLCQWSWKRGLKVCVAVGIFSPCRILRAVWPRSSCWCRRRVPAYWANTLCKNEEAFLGAVLDSYALLSGLLRLLILLLFRFCFCEDWVLFWIALSQRFRVSL